ncbi:bromodomain, NET domain protein [Artemisia annua]|uniref:Bromodomain, NET domain protein n=1 Tax=Artemisia annua TaxID=35608 RepID=A0A2U1LMH4_ARTAN|nr:bromodomain, NET domain protein [Artemisia annua]
MAPSLLQPLEFSEGHRMMGKTRKVSNSKGEKYGFVPDYRHAVETSEGYGSSAGRVDIGEGGDESCAPSGKFGVRYRVFSLAKMTSFERRELRASLELELEQVRSFQKSIERTLAPVPVLNSKKRVPPGRIGNGNVNRNGGVGVKGGGTIGYAMLMKQCETLLNRVMSDKFGWVFNEPVDIVKLKIPDYFTVIKHPMDLGTVKKKLLSGRYADPWGFVADVRLTFKNAMTYNPKGNDVHIMADTLSKFFEVRWKPIEKKLSALVVPTRQSVVEIQNKTVIETVAPAPMPPLKKKKIESFVNDVKRENVKRMSVEEKQKLTADLEATISELPDVVISFLREHSSNRDAAEDEIEIDLDDLSEEMLHKLRKLLDDYFAEKQKNMEKAETCEIELHNESGSNSSMEACKAVNDGNDEDIDIGGNDLPMSSFPPIEIEKDTAAYEDTSSDSGSSSSDSESDSSSDSELDGAKAPANTKDIEVDMEQITTVPQDSVNGLGQVDEQKSQSIPVLGEVDGHQEGESAPPERQVSPDKLYRAALLRSRFADTILKAQEKTNGKVEEQDRERLRLEKEELEKRRKAEKARLQAEAKAAEEALRNAELAAAAEAKRKRELEREASRQALQKMEKMVDINDNTRFLEDLEMLTVAPAKPLESFIDETSADGCQDPLGSFSFKGKGNPLEQLGLFMKNDDDEEDDIDDEEEGEID